MSFTRGTIGAAYPQRVDHRLAVEAVVDLTVVDDISARHGGGDDGVGYSRVTVARGLTEGGDTVDKVVEEDALVGDDVGQAVGIDIGEKGLGGRQVDILGGRGVDTQRNLEPNVVAAAAGYEEISYHQGLRRSEMEGAVAVSDMLAVVYAPADILEHFVGKAVAVDVCHADIALVFRPRVVVLAACGKFGPEDIESDPHVEAAAEVPAAATCAAESRGGERSGKSTDRGESHARGVDIAAVGEQGACVGTPNVTEVNVTAEKVVRRIVIVYLDAVQRMIASVEYTFLAGKIHIVVVVFLEVLKLFGRPGVFGYRE